MTRILPWTGLITSTEIVTSAPSNGWLNAALRSPRAHHTSTAQAAIWAITKAAKAQPSVARDGRVARAGFATKRGNFVRARSWGLGPLRRYGSRIEEPVVARLSRSRC